MLELTIRNSFISSFMTLFSERKGLKPVSKALQLEGMDADLRNSLWNVLFDTYLKQQVDNTNLYRAYWLSYFKRPIDEMRSERNLIIVRKHFFECKWNEVYDLIEFTIQNGNERHEILQTRFRQLCNYVLKQENSGYRFIGLEITPITSSHEIQAIEEALAVGLKSVEVHFESALSLLSDRKNPDYRNSIKESISAVESMYRLLSGDSKATLGVALKTVKDKASIHPALERAFSSLYGYTSDEGGIRHSLLEESNLTFTDAKFMLVICAGCTNYLIGKAADLGIQINES